MKILSFINFIIAIFLFPFMQSIIINRLKAKNWDLYLNLIKKQGDIVNERTKEMSYYIYSIRNEKDQISKILKIIHLFSIPYLLLSFIFAIKILI